MLFVALLHELSIGSVILFLEKSILNAVRKLCLFVTIIGVYLIVCGEKLLPPAYVVCGKVMFSLMFVCQSVQLGGGPM